MNRRAMVSCIPDEVPIPRLVRLCRDWWDEDGNNVAYEPVAYALTFHDGDVVAIEIEGPRRKGVHLFNCLEDAKERMSAPHVIPLGPSVRLPADLVDLGRALVEAHATGAGQ